MSSCDIPPYQVFGESCLLKPSTRVSLTFSINTSSSLYEYSAGLSTSGSATTWFRDQFGKDLLQAEFAGGANAYAALADEAASSPLGAKGLIMLPYMSGERTPIFDPKARGVIAGLSIYALHALITVLRKSTVTLYR